MVMTARLSWKALTAQQRCAIISFFFPHPSWEAEGSQQVLAHFFSLTVKRPSTVFCFEVDKRMFERFPIFEMPIPFSLLF
jgi:hypothetical protein